MKTISKYSNKSKALLLGGLFALTAMLGFAPTASATIGSDLQTAATTALTAVVVTLGVILVAAFAIPVGKKVYRIIKSAIGAAAITFALFLSQAGQARADIGGDLEDAATSSLAAVVVTLGVILVAAFAIPVGKKVYRIIKSAIGAA